MCGHTRPSPRAPPATGLSCSSSQGRLWLLCVSLSFLGPGCGSRLRHSLQGGPSRSLPPSFPRFHALSETAPLSPILASSILPFRALPPLALLRFKEWGSLFKLFLRDFCKKRESGRGRGWPRQESSAQWPGNCDPEWASPLDTHPPWTTRPEQRPWRGTMADE